MYTQIRFVSLCQLMLVGLLMFSSGCKKSKDSNDQPMSAEVLKTKLVAKWKLVSGSYTTYDANGKVLNTQDLSGPNLNPFYDFQENDKLYITDSREVREFYYTVSITAEGKMRILVDSAMYYDITSINGTDMNWTQDLTAKDDQPGNARRAHTEIHFQKM